LGGITFKHNKSLADVKRLRALFPINDGEVFSREKIAKGLENLQKAYGEFGFANYTGVPATTFDDEQNVAFLRIDADEGRQFIVGSINILGLDDLAQRALLKDHRNRANLQQETGRTVSLATQLPFPRLRMPNSGTIGHG
jgi:outer membrane protein assembly factor BamA